MDWVSSTYNAMEKADKLDVDAITEGEGDGGRRFFLGVPSNTVDELVHVVSVYLPDKGSAQFSCTCRADVGLMDPPAGWLSCWHMGTVARRLLSTSVIDFDRDHGFIGVAEPTPAEPERELPGWWPTS